jgi:E3 ubiquitin-protein ligase RNF5
METESGMRRRLAADMSVIDRNAPIREWEIDTVRASSDSAASISQDSTVSRDSEGRPIESVNGDIGSIRSTEIDLHDNADRERHIDDQSRSQGRAASDRQGPRGGAKEGFFSHLTVHARSRSTKSKKQDAKKQVGGGVEETEEQVMFSCNICYELAAEPVVTLCGHLYCWPCLYRWLQVQNNCRTCPVCKAGVDRDKVIPVYGRGGNEDPRAKKIDVDVVPSRPTGQRPIPVDNRGMIAGPGQNVVFPNIFGFTQGPVGFQDQLTPEQHHQAFLSRLLLMLGSFVIMCLLLF